MSMQNAHEIVKHYLACKYKAYLKLSGKVGVKNDHEKLQIKLETSRKQNFIQGLSDGNQIHDKGEIYCDSLEKRDGASALGEFHYIPVLVSINSRPSSIERKILGVSAAILERVQSRRPEIGKIITNDGEKILRISPKDVVLGNDVLKQLKDIEFGKDIPKLSLNPHCKNCEFQESCRAIAKEKDDLSLLQNMSEKEKVKQNKKGIFTVTQLSYTFRPRRRMIKKHFPELKALAIRENKVHILGQPQLDLPDVCMYFDIEGNPDAQSDYLIGLVVVDKGEEKRYSFWSDGKEKEFAMFREFLSVISHYSSYQLFHYGSYETRFLKRLRKQANKEDCIRIDDVLQKTVNILSIIYYSIYYPTYGNGLKEIGGYLGCVWSSPNASGLQSIVWRWEWEQRHRQDLKKKLIQYNVEDCLSLRRITEHIHAISKHEQSSEHSVPEVVWAKDVEVLLNTRPHSFENVDFCFQDLEYVNKCAYFDYQREKVYIRTNANIKRIEEQKIRKIKEVTKVNKIIRIKRPSRCPNCGCGRFTKNGRYHARQIDLVFFNYGVKKWLIEYLSHKYKCKRCKSLFIPSEYTKRRGKYGSNLTSWVVYQKIVNRQSFDQINETLCELFGISISKKTLRNLVWERADYYQTTHSNIVHNILQGGILHADETRAGIRKKNGYVWIFTNMEEASYLYKENREGEFLKELLKDFRGVLISDFYTAYDSLECPQQKCLIHLIRDLNDDVLQNPFDGEFKDLVGRFSVLLRAIINTIDKYGLKKRHLAKHKNQVNNFFDQALDGKYGSALVMKYRKRFKKNKEKIFTFLSYDGVPWNNNNAENAIKAFAVFRKNVVGLPSERTIEKYLVLLSVYQTCRFKGISFLHFLLSEDQNLDQFALSRSSHKNYIFKHDFSR